MKLNRSYWDIQLICDIVSKNVESDETTDTDEVVNVEDGDDEID